VLAACVACVLSFSSNDNKAREVQHAEYLYQLGYDALIDFDVDKAYCYLDSASNIFENYGLVAKSDSCYILLARVYYNFGNYQQARETMDLISDLNNLSVRYQALYHSMQSIIFTLVDEDYTNSVLSMKQAIHEDSVIHKWEWVYSDKANLAEIYIRSNQLDEAEKLLNSIADNPNPVNSFKVQYLYCWGLLHFERKQYAESVSYLERAKKFAKDNNMQVENLSALEMLTTIDSITQPEKLHIQHYQEYIRVQNNINAQKKRYQISILNAQNSLKIRQIEDRSQRRAFVYSIIMLVLVILVLLAIAVILFLQFKKSQREKKLIELKINLLNKEITNEKLELELLQLRMKQEQETLNKVNQENQSIHMRLAAISPDKDQVKKDLLKDVPPVFYSALERQFPGITKNDVRLAWLIKQHIPNEDIIRILGLTKQSLYTSRYRLRKRLDLESNADLNKFLNSIS